MSEDFDPNQQYGNWCWCDDNTDALRAAVDAIWTNAEQVVPCNLMSRVKLAFKFMSVEELQSLAEYAGEEIEITQPLWTVGWKYRKGE